MRLAHLLALCLLGAVLSAGEATPATAPAADGPVAYIPIAQDIDELRLRYFQRALHDAAERGAKRVVVHLDTNGGLAHVGIAMVEAAMAASSQDHMRLIAFVDGHCFSAGALIAYAHDEIRLTPTAIIGDIGVILINPAEPTKIEYAPEKLETGVRAELRKEAQVKGWDQAKLQKMTARNQELYRFDLDGRQEFVLEDDLPQWLHDHPQVTSDDKILVAGKDRLLTYTGKEAVDAKMATGLVASLDDLYAQLGVTRSSVIDLSPTDTELMAWRMSGWAPILAALAALCLFLEFKTGGTGLWLIGAAVFGIAFITCQYYQQLAGYPEVILMLLGVACVAVELFVFPTAGWLLVLGLLLGGAGLVLSFMPDVDQFHPSTEGWSDELTHALLQSVWALSVVTGGSVVLFATLPQSRAMRRLAAHAEIASTSASATEASGALVGRRARARTPLSPSGSITIDGRDLSATTEHGEFLAAGAEVEVVAMRYGAAVVRAAQPAVAS
jgi:membrane-bound serine protease (ClpP class)